MNSIKADIKNKPGRLLGYNARKSILKWKRPGRRAPEMARTSMDTELKGGDLKEPCIGAARHLGAAGQVHARDRLSKN